MANATLQMLLASRGPAVPSFPASALAVYMPDYILSVQNSSGGICDFYEGVYQIKDLSGNGYHGVQTTASLRPLFIKWEGTNYYWGAGGSNGSRMTWLSASSGGNDPLPTNFQFTIKCSAVSWASGAVQYLLNKTTYIDIYLDAAGTVSFKRVGAAGSTVHTSTAAIGFAANGIGWIRLTYVNDTGGGQYSAVFETSTDGTTWGALGTTVTGASEAAMVGSASNFAVGGQTAATTLGFRGRIYQVSVQDTSAPAARIVWTAASSTHAALSGVSVSGGNVTYTPSNNIRSTGVLIGKSVLAYNPASGASCWFNTPSIPLTPNFQIAARFMGCSGGAGPIYNTTFLLGMIITGGTNYVANNTRRASVADGVTPNSYRNLVGELNGNNYRIIYDGSSTGGGTAAVATAGSHDGCYFFYGTGILGRVGGWIYANRPTDAAMNTWLSS